MKVSTIKSRTVEFFKKQCVFFIRVLKKTKSIKFNRKTVVAIIVLFTAIILPIIPLSTLTLAYEVKYEDISLGFISGEKVNETEKMFENTVTDGTNSKADYSMTIVPTQSVETTTEISQNLVNNTSITDAYGIYINEKCVASNPDRVVLVNALQSVKSSITAKENADVVFFNENIKIDNCLSPFDLLNNFDETVEIISKSVTYKTGIYKTKTVTKKYKTIEKEDSSIYAGITKVETEGKNGKEEIETLTLFTNGKKVSSKVVNRVVTVKPTNEVILKGKKARPNVTKKNKYLWPIDENASCYVSSPFGSRGGRLHKGIDIIADYGVNILAAEDGVVTRASWYDAYGYCVDIVHKDGTLTRYAHCSSLIAEVGEQVVTGQVIAKVGSTGRSTANHLHFEVCPDGTNPVNPYNYVTK